MSQFYTKNVLFLFVEKNFRRLQATTTTENLRHLKDLKDLTVFSFASPNKCKK